MCVLVKKKPTIITQSRLIYSGVNLDQRNQKTVPMINQTSEPLSTKLLSPLRMLVARSSLLPEISTTAVIQTMNSVPLLCQILCLQPGVAQLHSKTQMSCQNAVFFKHNGLQTNKQTNIYICIYIFVLLYIHSFTCIFGRSSQKLQNRSSTSGDNCSVVVTQVILKYLLCRYFIYSYIIYLPLIPARSPELSNVQFYASKIETNTLEI